LLTRVYYAPKDSAYLSGALTKRDASAPSRTSLLAQRVSCSRVADRPSQVQKARQGRSLLGVRSTKKDPASLLSALIRIFTELGQEDHLFSCQFLQGQVCAGIHQAFSHY